MANFILYNLKLMLERLNQPHYRLPTKLALGALLLSGCATTGNESAVRNPSAPGIASGSIPKGVNVRYSAGVLDEPGDGSSNICGKTKHKIDLTDVPAVTVTGVDTNGSWLGFKQSDIGSPCPEDKDGVVWISQRVFVGSVVAANTLQASTN